jgi:hypothetical protein
MECMEWMFGLVVLVLVLVIATIRSGHWIATRSGRRTGRPR